MRRWLATALATVSLAAPLLVSPAAAETIHFRNATWPPTPLQQRLAHAPGQTIAEQASVRLTGELYRPPGNGPFPAVILLHPCSGRLPARVEAADAARYTALGYALLALDSFGARGIVDGCTGGGSSVDVVMDAYGALLHLASLPFIDPDRIALVGYAYGGAMALSAVAFDGPERLFDRQFRAAIAFYPPCLGHEGAVGAPTLIFAGGLDDWAPAKHCQALLTRRRSGLGEPLRIVVLPDAHHGFNLKIAPRRTYGYRLEYSEAADQSAWRDAVAFLRQAFGR